MNISGIYKISSKIKPERIYIGSAINIRRRWNEHKKELRENKHHSRKLQNHYNKYGIDDVVYEIIIECDKDQLIANEQFFIDAFHPFFNTCPIAYSCLGMKLSSEAKAKISESNRRRVVSPETRVKMSLKNKGRIMSEESKIKMSKSGKGRIFTEEHKRKISESNKGKQFTEKHKRLMSEAWKHRVVTEETKKRISESHKGVKNSFFGKHHSEETKNKIKETKRQKLLIKQKAIVFE